MSGILIGFFTVVLVLVSAFIVLIVLMQRASSNSGMGAALGGGAAESALGGEAGNVLTRGTIIASVLFFVIAFGLYLGHMAKYEGITPATGVELPTIEVPVKEETAPVDTGLTDLPTPSELKDAATEAETTVEEVKAEAEATVETVTEKVEEVVTDAAETVEETAKEVESTLEEATELKVEPKLP